MSFVFFGPIAVVLVFGMFALFAEFWPAWWFMFPLGLVGLVGIHSLTEFISNGSRPLRSVYLRVAVLGFLISDLALCVKAGLFDGGFGITLYYIGSFGVFLMVALTLPILGTMILLWSAREYVLDRK